LEASRVLAVLDESLEDATLLSYVTTDVLDTAEQLREMLGADMVSALLRHRSALGQSAKTTLPSDTMNQSTWELVRLLKKSPATPKLKKLQMEPSPGMTQVTSYFSKLRRFAQKRLTTTVEEDSSNRQYYEEVKEREERAVSEKIQLEQKLKLQRVELHKQATQMQSTADRLRAQLHELGERTKKEMANIGASAKSVRAEDFSVFDEERGELQKELDAANATLARMREEHKEAEAGLYKSKKREQQDVESVINEYDADLGSKDEEYQAANKEYREVLDRLELLRKEYHEMHADRMEHEERERQEAQRRLEEGLRRVRINRAARVIQGGWKALKARRAAEAKKAKKEAAKKKK